MNARIASPTSSAINASAITQSARTVIATEASAVQAL
jgi:hypothetical protein